MIPSPDELARRAALAELAERSKNRRAAPQWLDPDFQAQAQFIADPSRKKAARCTRRAGKSYGAGLYLFKEAYENPHVKCLYIALTRASAKSIMWRDVLKTIDRKYGLGCEFNETELTATLPNGSLIQLAGADANPDDMQKFLGQKYRLAIIDEAASWRQDLNELVHGVLEPAMGDLDGTICLIGTPSNIKRGLFYRITTGQSERQDAKWSVHKWSALDNPYQAAQTRKQLEEIERDRPLFMETPIYKQHFLGEWVIDDSKLVYRYDPGRNLYSGLPEAPHYNWVLGVDLGFNDDSAFSVVAYSPHDSSLYGTECFKRVGMDITDVADRIRHYQDRYILDTIVIDGANKQAVEEIKKRHGIPLRPADKRGKVDFIEILNAEMTQGKVRVHESTCQALTDEWSNLVWDEKLYAATGKRQENATCPNHLADSFLYAWRHCYQYLATEKTRVIREGTSEWYEAEAKRMEDEALKAHQDREDDLFDLDFPA